MVLGSIQDSIIMHFPTRTLVGKKRNGFCSVLVICLLLDGVLDSAQARRLCFQQAVAGQLGGTLRTEQVQTSDRSNVSPVNMVASVHPLATEAGLKALEQGGNAVDAAIATALTLGVVDGFNSGIGGGCFVLIRTASGDIIALDGREKAPAAAHRDMYLRDGVADSRLSQAGALAMGVPGALAAYHEAAMQYGRLKFADLIFPAAEIAETGFPVTRQYRARVEMERDALRQFPASASVLLKQDGSARNIGDIIRQPDLANSYRQIAEHGIEWFYQGPFAEQVHSWCQANGGILTAQDFANYQIVRRTPLRTRYRDFELIGFPPPSSGGVHVAQILNILENFELSNRSPDEYQASLHLIAEAMKLAFADRAYWLGDPDYINVPRGLTDKSYAKQLAGMIDSTRSTPVHSHGFPPNHEDVFFEKHTTHIAAADDEGNWVAITTTLNTTFGSKVTIPGMGVMMNNQMDDFSIAPGVPNAFGLIGGENNAVAGGKRPLSSMSPTIVLKDGQPILTIGAAGGPTIITQVVMGIVRHLDFGQPVDEAVNAPRIHHQWSPDKLRVEGLIGEAARASLSGKGHAVDVVSGLGATQAIAFDPATSLYHGVSDERVPGSALGLVPSRK
jgi:gamma-glutamyltranspeptidase/glutathione hydrolase